MRNIKNVSGIQSNMITSANSNSVGLLEDTGAEYCKGYGIMLNIDVNTPSAVTFDSGVSEVSTATFPDAGAKAALILEDLTYTAVSKGVAGNSTSITYVDPNTPSATISVGVIGQAITVNLATDAGTAASGIATITSYADLLVTTPDTIAVAGVVFTAQAGVATLGDATFQAATDNNTTAESLRVQVNAHATSGPLVTGVRVGAAVTFTADATGVAGNAFTLVYDDNGAEIGATVSGAGTFAGGVDNVHISTAAQIRTAVLAAAPAAALVAVAISGTGTDIQAAVGATLLTGGDNSGITAGDYLVIYDTAGLGWAIAADMGGSSAPTGAIWTSIAAGRKALVDLSANLTAAQVAAAFEVAFDALTSVPFATDDSAADGTMLFTVTLRGNTTDADVNNADDSAAGSIAVVTSVVGVNPEDNVTANTFYVPAHVLTLGLKGRLTTTGTLPAGLSLATDYFVIVVDANNIKFAASLALAIAGTAVDISDQGSEGAVNTFTATAIGGASYQVQVSADNEHWVSPAAAVAITADADVYIEKLDPMYDWVRVAYLITAGQMSVIERYVVKGE